MKGKFFAISLMLGSTVCLAAPEDLKKAIIKSDLGKVKKQLGSDLEKAESVVSEVGATKKELVDLAETMKEFRGKKAELGFNSHIKRMLLGGAMVGVGVIKEIFDLVYGTDNAKKGEGTGLYTSDHVTNAAITAYGGYYIYLGATKKDPSKQLANATKILSLLNERLNEEKSPEEE